MSELSEDSERLIHLDSGDSSEQESSPDDDAGDIEDGNDLDDEDDEEEDEDEPNGMFDLEASESNGSSSDEHSDRDPDDGDMDRTVHFFPQFNRLPIEIRLHIWEHFCPDLTVTGRVYEPPDESGTFHHFVLAHQTRASRVVLAVHRESREFALKSFPDVFCLPESICTPQIVLRFHKKNDIISLAHGGFSPYSLDQSLADQVCNLAMSLEYIIQGIRSPALPLLRSLRMFFLLDHTDCSAPTLHWCTSKKAKIYAPPPHFEYNGLGVKKTYQQLYSWPDLDNHRDFAERGGIPLKKIFGFVFHGRIVFPGVDLDGESDSDDPDAEANRGPNAKFTKWPLGMPVWPLVEFSDDVMEFSGIHRFDRIRDWKESFDKYDDPEFDRVGIEDEYDSSGIDDSEIEEGASESEDDLIVLDGDDAGPDDPADSDGNASEFGGFSLTHARGGIVDLTADDEIPAAQFSSPEPDSTTLPEESDGPGSNEPQAPRAKLSRSRKRVLESDEDEDEEEEAPRKRARYVSKSEGSESGSSSDAPGEEAESEDSDGEDRPAKLLTLAEKLELHRQQNPAPEPDEEDSGEENSDQDSDINLYMDDPSQWCEEGDESGEDEDADDQGEMMAGMDEEDEDEGEDEEEY